MVHALELARWHLARGGTLVLIQPLRSKRPFIAVKTGRRRQEVGFLVNPVFEPIITAAEAAIDSIVDRKVVVPAGKTEKSFAVELTSLRQLDAYLYGGVRPPRFAPGGRRRLEELWRARTQGARIEVTEFMTVMAFRPA